MIRKISGILTTSALSLALFAAAPAFAGSESCSCDKKCSAACEKGKGEDCKCKECGCAKGHCKHGKCKHHKKTTNTSAESAAPEGK